jgi:hypothetical protein
VTLPPCTDRETEVQSCQGPRYNHKDRKWMEGLESKSSSSTEVGVLARASESSSQSRRSTPEPQLQYILL